MAPHLRKDEIDLLESTLSTERYRLSEIYAELEDGLYGKDVVGIQMALSTAIDYIDKALAIRKIQVTRSDS